jgi:DNA repair protein RadC
MPITDWPLNERPREKLLAHGAGALSDAELLALFLRTGIEGKTAVDLAREMVQTFGGLNGLFAASLKDFSAIKGLGEAKYAQLQAVLEMARRALHEELAAKVSLNQPRKVKEYLRLLIGHKAHEVFVCLYLDSQHLLIATEQLTRGTIDHTPVFPREVAKAALAKNAASVIFAHNHLSANAQPSQSDLQLTETLKQALGLLEIRVVDHIVVAEGCEFSFKEHGLL